MFGGHDTTTTSCSWTYWNLEDLLTNIHPFSDGYIIPAGANVSIAPVILHSNHHVFKNPENFDPDRFLPEECSKRHPYDFVPFSAGIKNCIGQKFSISNEKVMVAHLVRNFDIKPMLKFNETLPCFEAVAKPSKGIPVKLTRPV
ncbi:hypothetical protein CAEBREN_03411 [Caenorhabditis brenneri]|uniref:Uncharacterized protein n=1 Tax=Caenorhabditis brenneri TaxID=135651 RepID=G0NWQ7_CAEBE|nr:hypothetical protein CAEBREN_03411 [Caenorhabditis brenneri]